MLCEDVMREPREMWLYIKLKVCTYFVVMILLFRDFYELLQAVQRNISHLLIISTSAPAPDMLCMSLCC